MTAEEFYGEMYPSMRKAEQQLLDLAAKYQHIGAGKDDAQPIVYCCSRIKSAESMINKLKKNRLPQNKETALTKIYDAIGIRIICAFADDVYQIACWITEQPELEVIQTKDYIAYPKPNGYRSYHLLLKIKEGPGKGLPAEIQMRTIAIDFWATLEHQLKYKKNIPHEKLIQSELKRCADEIASVDLSMQAIRDILKEEK